MQTTGLQEFIKSIFNDERTRRQFISDPEGFVTQSGLSEPEKRAVLETRSQWGLAGGNSAQMEGALRDTTGWLAPE
jgi:hypothetical protein